MSDERALLGGLDGMAISRAWQFDRPPQVQEEVERVYAMRGWMADVWLRLYDGQGAVVYDAILPGQINPLDGTKGYATVLHLQDYPLDLDRLLATHGADLQYLWMEVSERRPPPSRPGYSTPYAPPKALSPVGKFVFIGGLVLLVLELWTLLTG